MFGLLNPLALWLFPLLAAPLMIHFLGRREPRRRDFPSLMPVRGRLTQAMRRHRLKNWLQLLLRTLALLFLLLAAANPLWRSRNAWTPPTAASVLIHNGAYGGVPMNGTTALMAQRRLQHGLDSLTSGNSRAELLFPEIPDGEPSARFGRYADALPRLLASASGDASLHLYLPVFDWRDLEGCGELLRRTLRQNPNLRVVLIEYPSSAARLTPFSGSSLGFPKENLVSLRMGFAGSSPSALWTPQGESPREISAVKDSLEIRAPLLQAGWLTGEFSLPPPAGDRFAFPSAAVAARIPPPSTLCHVGSAFASLASLGSGSARARIRSFQNEQEFASTSCDFLYLADPENVSAALLERAAEILRGGGKVILGLGRRSDAALLNRSLLEPLGVGRLTELKRGASVPVRPNKGAFAALGMRVANWSDPGAVSSHLALLRDSGTNILLAAGNDPILVQRNIGKGSLLLWTTDIDDPEWTDLGLGPWPVLIHQAFLEGSWNSGIGAQEIASDSVFLLSAPESGEVRVTDPDGQSFRRLQRNPDGFAIGPFDRIGLYRIERADGKNADTTWLAVGLDPGRLRPDAEARDRFLSALGDVRSQAAVRDADGDWRNLYGGFRLRTWMGIAAALLLFLEGMVSLRLGPMRFDVNPLVARRD